jgi:hypothetical protein
LHRANQLVESSSLGIVKVSFKWEHIHAKAADRGNNAASHNLDIFVRSVNVQLGRFIQT